MHFAVNFTAAMDFRDISVQLATLEGVASESTSRLQVAQVLSLLWSLSLLVFRFIKTHRPLCVRVCSTVSMYSSCTPPPPHCLPQVLPELVVRGVVAGADGVIARRGAWLSDSGALTTQLHTVVTFVITAYDEFGVKRSTGGDRFVSGSSAC